MKTTVCTLLAAATLFGIAHAQEKIDKTLEAPEKGVVTVKNVSGSVEVSGWDRNEVHVTGTLGKGTEELVLTRDANETRIEVKLPDHGRHTEGSDLNIQVPAGSRLEVETVSAGIEVSDVKGRLKLKSVSGGVSVRGEPEDLEAHSVSGNIDVTVSSKEIEAETVSGTISVEGVKERVEASSVSGTIEVTGGNLNEAKFESVSGKISYEGGLQKDGRLDANNFSGLVELRLPKSVAGEFEISTFSGNIENEFGAESTRTSTYAPGSELRFSRGSGGARISVETFSGTVRLIKQ